MFRLEDKNECPWIGSVPYTPAYLYLKKENGYITEISTLPSPVR